VRAAARATASRPAGTKTGGRGATRPELGLNPAAGGFHLDRRQLDRHGRPTQQGEEEEKHPSEPLGENIRDKIVDQENVSLNCSTAQPSPVLAKRASLGENIRDKIVDQENVSLNCSTAQPSPVLAKRSPPHDAPGRSHGVSSDVSR